MNILLLNILVAAVFLVLLFSLWGVVHLFSGKRFGQRELTCKGPQRNEEGQMMCCHEDKLCDSAHPSE